MFVTVNELMTSDDVTSQVHVIVGGTKPTFAHSIGGKRWSAVVMSNVLLSYYVMGVGMHFEVALFKVQHSRQNESRRELG